MTRSALIPAVLAAPALSALLFAAAYAQPAPAGQTDTVAGAFIAAAQAQDRQAVLQLLDENVSIRFPARDVAQGHGEGQPFVIGYLDGLFSGDRAVSLDGGASPRDGAVRFLAHDVRSHDRYAIDVEVKNAHVVRVTVNRQAEAAPGQTVAAINPS